MFYTIVLICDFLMMIANGVAFKVVYDWYLLKIFGLPQISIFHAIGILMLISFSTASKSAEPIIDKDKMKDAFIKAILNGASRILVTIAFAWVFHFFVK